jgi:hypothetical protein
MTLGEGQHAYMPPLHIHGVFNKETCISINTTYAAGASIQQLPQTLGNLASLE